MPPLTKHNRPLLRMYDGIGLGDREEDWSQSDWDPWPRRPKVDVSKKWLHRIRHMKDWKVFVADLGGVNGQSFFTAIHAGNNQSMQRSVQHYIDQNASGSLY